MSQETVDRARKAGAESTGSAGPEPVDHEVEIRVPIEARGDRLDVVLARLYTDMSRSRLTSLIKAGQVLVDGQEQRPKFSVSGGEQLLLKVPQAPTEDARGQAIELDVVHEDDDVIIINKQAGLTVHPGAGAPDGTMLNALLHRFPELGGLPRAGIVHRLDKDTTGLLAVARSERAHRTLVEALAMREVHREYLAVVRGVPTAGGEVDADIGRHPRHRTRMSAVANGRTALTHYRIEKKFGHHTVLAVQLETGRTHQIRVHMAHIGHPLVGDPTYGGRAHTSAGLPGVLRDYIAGFERQALHARSLGFLHPGDGSEVEFQAPLPTDITNLVAQLTRHDT